MEVCGNSGRPHHIFPRSNKGKFLRHQFDVKGSFARHQETMICQVRQGALDLAKFGPLYFGEMLRYWRGASCHMSQS
jgi:hypothetical protein